MISFTSVACAGRSGLRQKRGLPHCRHCLQYRQRHRQGRRACHRGKLRPRGADRFHPAQVRHGAEADFEHDLHRLHKTKTCPHCGKVFTPTSNRQLFCSRECWNEARQEQKKADREAERGTHYYRQRTCAVCGHSYWPTHSQQEFCSDECRRINHNRKTLEFYHKKKGNPKPDPEAVPTPKPKVDNAA